MKLKFKYPTLRELEISLRKEYLEYKEGLNVYANDLNEVSVSLNKQEFSNLIKELNERGELSRLVIQTYLPQSQEWTSIMNNVRPFRNQIRTGATVYTPIDALKRIINGEEVFSENSLHIPITIEGWIETIKNYPGLKEIRILFNVLNTEIILNIDV